MKHIRILITSILLSILAVSCNQKESKLNGIWEYQLHNPKRYFIKDSIPQSYKDSMIARLRTNNERYNVRRIIKITNHNFRTGDWAEDEQKYYLSSRAVHHKFDTLTRANSSKLGTNLLDKDTLYYMSSAYHDGLPSTLEYISPDSINEYLIYRYNTQYGDVRLVEITPMTRLRDERMIKYN